MSGERPFTGTATLDQTFQRALSLHQNGLLRAAESLYRAVLEADRRHLDALLYCGVLRLQQGDADESAILIREALAQNPASAEAHANLASALQALNRHDEAIVSYERALALKPTFAQASYGLATALQALRQHEEAVVRYEAALAIEPTFADASYGLADALRALQQYDEAISRYKTALAVDPDHAEASCGLGNTLQTLQRYDEAIPHYNAALTVDPNYAEAHSGLAAVFHAQKRHDEAITCYRRALSINPDHAETHNNLGNALQAMKRCDEAFACYEAALAIKPEFAAAHHNFGNALQALDRHDEAVVRYEKALAIAPEFAEAHVNCAAALQALNRHEEALTHCEAALLITPTLAAAHNNRGRVLEEIGRISEACHAFEKAIEIAPRSPGLYVNLFNCRKVRAGDPYLAAVEELERDRGSLTDDERIKLDFALSKAYSDTGQHERSFRHLLDGNALKRRQILYDETAVLRWFESVQKNFTAAVIRKRRNLGDPSSAPIFIVGMMRSGTTLVEQIVASHPKVFGAGERKDFSNVVDAVGIARFIMAPRTVLARTLTGERLRRLGAAYLASIRADAPAADKITDKMPANFGFVGLIHLALPNARIIHSCRDSVDTCLSCFSKLFNDEQPFAYDLGELGRYYRAYRALMKHWRSVLPAGVMLDVKYEELVTNFELQARRIVAHCGLEWHDACLSFYETQRPVKTASAIQIRQPIYSSAVGRWRPDRELLRPLLDALGPASVI
jgi:tetratricopeptide (TPR) repeat protein